MKAVGFDFGQTLAELDYEFVKQRLAERGVAFEVAGAQRGSEHAWQVYGARKADAVARTVEGPVAAFFPASALQLHPHASVVVDEAAAAALRLAEYYREAYAGKPDWQGL